jgi:hypothetical protein
MDGLILFHCVACRIMMIIHFNTRVNIIASFYVHLIAYLMMLRYTHFLLIEILFFL